MNHFLTCYFQQFENIPRSSLHDRRKRKEIVDYFSTLIEGCSRGEEISSQKTAKEAILCILRYHQDQKSKNGTICLMAKYHNILYVGLKLSFDWQVQDSSVIALLLEDIFDCEQTFERLFVGAIFGTKAPHYIAGWKSDFRDQEENLRAVVFFLSNASTAGLEFTFKKHVLRFVDVPIESCGKSTPLIIAVQLGVPDKVMIFVRFGALVHPPHLDQEETDVLQYLLNRLMEFAHQYPFNLVACLQILLRVVPRILAKKADDVNPFLERYKTLIEDGIVPQSRCGLSPVELKHLCRCEVRQRLWVNHQLPDGVQDLPIPDSLKRYVDVMED